MKTKILSIVLGCASIMTSYAQDWANIPIPANAGSNRSWKLHEPMSDSFNYNGKNNSNFNNKWVDKYVNPWRGPGFTYFNESHSNVTGGNLVLRSSRRTGRVVNTGIISSKGSINYPCYVEISMKINGLSTANNFWFISQDQRNELDVTETYGDTPWFRERMSTNYHIFKRANGQILEDYGHVQQKHRTDPPVDLGLTFHRYGMHWKSETEMIFYLDGKPVRWLNRSNDLNDPEGKFFDRAMKMVIDVENHEWRTNLGQEPSNAQLNNNSRNRMFVDWVRVYRSVPDNGSGEGSTFFVQNRATGKFIRPQFDRVNSIIAQAPNTWKGNYTQWSIQPAEGEWFHLKNKQTNYYLQPEANVNDARLIQVSTAANNKWQTQWRKVNTSGGYFYLQSRWTGRYFRPRSNADLATGGNFGMQLKPKTYAGNYTQWRFVNSENKTLVEGPMNASFDFYPVPAKDVITVIATNDSYDITLLDINGRKIKSFYVGQESTVEIIISDLNPGIYLLQSISKAGSVLETKKLIIN